MVVDFVYPDGLPDVASNRRASSRASTGVLPRRTLCAGVRYRRGWVRRHNLARNQPIEQMTYTGEALLYGRNAYFVGELLHPRRDVKRLGAPRQFRHVPHDLKISCR